MALILFLLVLCHAYSSCSTTTDRDLISLAFSSVSGFQLTLLNSSAAAVKEIRLPSKNLRGTVSWMFLRNISTLRTVDLSGNALEGSVPGRFWSAPALSEVNLAGNHLGGSLRFVSGSSSVLRQLNLSGNRFTSVIGVDGVVGIQVLDLSHNDLGVVPSGLKKLRVLKYLDLSHNSMVGVFPKDFPPLAGITHLNISYNKLTGRVDPKEVNKFGSSAFTRAGSLTFFSNSSAHHGPPPTTAADKKKQSTLKRAIIAGCSSLVGFVLFVVLVLVCVKRRKKRRKERTGERKEEEGTVSAAQEGRWVAEARWLAPVVVFEKPLMEMTFSDLVAATSGFGRESQLSDGGRCGRAYRAVLPGDMHVVVRVVESARDIEERDAEASFRELARLRHPNLLPLLGYCIPGKEKLLLYEYMERGDLHRWLHELPAGNPALDDFTGETWDHHHGDAHGSVTAAAATGDWATRHRVLLGIARGLAFLHQGWAGSSRPVVHGHLVPSNILLSDDLEPRIADFSMGAGGVGVATAEGDVYDYGIMVMEMVTGREGWSETEVERMRGIVRSGRVVDVVYTRQMGGGGGAAATEEREVVECLRVGLLCTAQEPHKRPTMQQVVGLLKDVRPTAFC